MTPPRIHYNARHAPKPGMFASWYDLVVFVAVLALVGGWMWIVAEMVWGMVRP